jgi:hypothetical protein
MRKNDLRYQIEDLRFLMEEEIDDGRLTIYD